MTRQEITAFFADREQMWARRDAGALAAGHAEHGTVASPIFGSVQGRAAIEVAYRDLFVAFADWELVGLELIIDIDAQRVAQPFRSRATHNHDFFGLAGTGRRFEIHGVLLFDLDAGLIMHEHRTYDFTGLLVQLGVLKAKPGRP